MNKLPDFTIRDDQPIFLTAELVNYPSSPIRYFSLTETPLRFSNLCLKAPTPNSPASKKPRP